MCDSSVLFSTRFRNIQKECLGTFTSAAVRILGAEDNVEVRQYDNDGIVELSFVMNKSICRPATEAQLASIVEETIGQLATISSAVSGISDFNSVRVTTIFWYRVRPEVFAQALAVPASSTSSTSKSPRSKSPRPSKE